MPLFSPINASHIPDRRCRLHRRASYLSDDPPLSPHGPSPWRWSGLATGRCACQGKSSDQSSFHQKPCRDACGQKADPTPHASPREAGLEYSHGRRPPPPSRLSPGLRAVPEQIYGINRPFPRRAGASHSKVPYIQEKTAIVFAPFPLSDPFLGGFDIRPELLGDGV